VDYNRVVLIQERLVERQQTLAEAQGQIALGLIQVYRALGGGWQIRCEATAVPAVSHAVPGQAPAPAHHAADPEPVSDRTAVRPAGQSDDAEKADPNQGLWTTRRRR
jgi:hypothetical protein